ncbi:hypothetical protein FN846DRAFT_975629 [Sphaerosporella brunnea]|uniref:Peptidase S8/S53 domain-containing protein n=1 Tax=Sphaerosporella brunnea TaxID=1250544 RepID=A0A5J5EHG2_9PEZI|nr:hypothetical protein FN846DRAFT_975629 [Sphaerosporella brunnea]
MMFGIPPTAGPKPAFMRFSEKEFHSVYAKTQQSLTAFATEIQMPEDSKEDIQEPEDLDEPGLDFLDLSELPLGNPEAANAFVRDLVDRPNDLFFQPHLRKVDLGSVGKKDLAIRILKWLRFKRGVTHIHTFRSQPFGQSNNDGDDIDDTDGDVLKPLDIKKLEWLALHISIQTVEAVAPNVEEVTVVWKQKLGPDGWLFALKHGTLEKLKKINIASVVNDKICFPRGHVISKNLIPAFMNRLASCRPEIEVSYYEPHVSGELPDLAISNDNSPDTGDDWFNELQRWRLHPIHELTPPSPVRVAILDTGVDAFHPILRDKIVAQKSFLPQAHDFVDSVGHGTHLAGLVLKVAPQADILVGRVFTRTKKDAQTAAEGIQWAIDNKVDIILCSWGFRTEYERDALEKVIKLAFESDICVIAATPNRDDATSKDYTYPAEFEEVLAIAGCGQSAERRVFTCPKHDFLFPGTNLSSAYPRYLAGEGESEFRLSGSSMAAAVAAGYSAMLLEYRSALDIGKRKVEFLRTLLRAVMFGKDEVSHRFVTWKDFNNKAWGRSGSSDEEHVESLKKFLRKNLGPAAVDQVAPPAPMDAGELQRPRPPPTPCHTKSPPAVRPSPPHHFHRPNPFTNGGYSQRNRSPPPKYDSWASSSTYQHLNTPSPQQQRSKADGRASSTSRDRQGEPFSRPANPPANPSPQNEYFVCSNCGRYLPPFLKGNHQCSLRQAKEQEEEEKKVIDDNLCPKCNYMVPPWKKSTHPCFQPALPAKALKFFWA